ncbi:Uncharacterised protein [uncultured archaeon]|nr:Uncharacterised protein [uncultured archaeon]
MRKTLLILCLTVAISACLSQTSDYSINGQVKWPTSLTRQQQQSEITRLLTLGTEEVGYTCNIVSIPSWGQNITADYAVSGKRIRMVQTNPQTNITTVGLQNEDGLFIFDPVNKSGIKIVDSSQMPSYTSISSQMAVDTSGASIVGEDMFDNRRVVVIDLDYPSAKGRVWLWKDHGVPLRIVTREERGLSEFNCFDAKINPPEKLFLIPDDVEIKDVSPLLTQMVRQNSSLGPTVTR